ncbi:uncharacterized protein LOC134177324 [Corticium candelabrum]|uniref:uncharacterized protein LOC134177324 n=1 Tax=Corticium candelabrum TaxID=121492 RepID=UPI002E263ED5|nr:uncharacterized protein LOC134177324 [Corticium candelabrum]
MSRVVRGFCVVVCQLIVCQKNLSGKKDGRKVKKVKDPESEKSPSTSTNSKDVDNEPSASGTRTAAEEMPVPDASAISNSEAKDPENLEKDGNSNLPAIGDIVHLLDNKNINVGTGQICGLHGSLCHMRPVPQSHMKVKVQSLSGGHSETPYPWTENIYWHHEPVMPNSFLVWPAKFLQKLQLVQDGSSSRATEGCERKCKLELAVMVGFEVARLRDVSRTHSSALAGVWKFSLGQTKAKPNC